MLKKTFCTVIIIAQLMKIVADVVVFGSFLNSCRIASQLHLSYDHVPPVMIKTTHYYRKSFSSAGLSRSKRMTCQHQSPSCGTPPQMGVRRPHPPFTGIRTTSSGGCSILGMTTPGSSGAVKEQIGITGTTQYDHITAGLHVHMSNCSSSYYGLCETPADHTNY